MKECTYYVDGMHCASCEVLIEKRLLKIDGVENVDASTGSKTVKFQYKGKNDLSTKELNTLFKDSGYTFSTKELKKNDEKLFIITDDNILQINSVKFSSILNTLLVTAVILVLFIFVNKLELGKYYSVTSNSAVPAFFTLGLIAGVSSCAALVGGLLLSMVKTWNEQYITSNSLSEKATPHLLFHVGRIVTFTVLGGVLGALGKGISFENNSVFAYLTIGVSLFMILLALQMLEVRFAQKLTIAAPKFLRKSVTNESNFQSKYSPLLLGALTFLVPCGFTLVAQGAALASGSFIKGALILLAFSLGTLIPLGAISYSGLKMNTKPHMTAKFNKIAGILIVFFALYNINGQLNVLSLPSFQDIKFESKSKTEDIKDIQFAELNEKNEQVLNFTANGFRYTPNSSTNLKAGVPARLIMNNLGIQGCGAYMGASGLFRGYIELKDGINEVPFTPQKGTYKLTCSMGMVPPVIIKVY